MSNAGKARIDTIIKCSKSYKDGPDTCPEVKLADDNRAYDNVSPKRRRSSGDSTFSFLWQCLFCGSNCNVVRPERIHDDGEKRLYLDKLTLLKLAKV